MRRLVFAILAIAVSACATIQPLPVPHATQAGAVIEGSGEKGPEIKFASVTNGLPTGERTTVVGVGYDCTLRYEVKSNTATFKDTYGKRVAIVVSDELKKANYNVVGDPNNPFSEALGADAEYLLGAKVLNIKSKTCVIGKEVSGEKIL